MSSGGHVILCNGAKRPKTIGRSSPTSILEYRPTFSKRNVTVGLPAFIENVLHLPARVLDLLEIASYVFAADRLISRGDKEALEYHAWSLDLHFVMRVRDIGFWKRKVVKETLAEALRFMSGHRSYSFTFEGGHTTPSAGLFDTHMMENVQSEESDVLLFSGGLDSLAGALERLENATRQVCLVSHRSQAGTIRTQQALVKALTKRYPTRVGTYPFQCTLHGVRATEETQRTRAFLYCSIGYAIARALGQHKLFVYENGVTSLNFLRRQDLLNARATRTTHPRTITLIESLFSLLGDTFLIETPFFDRTKSEVLDSIHKHQADDLVSSSVSCSKTFKHLEQATHCGGCSQCIDRRLASYSSGMDDVDSGGGIYALDFVREAITDGEIRTTLVDYIRQAVEFSNFNIDHFQNELLDELALLHTCRGFEDDVLVNRAFQVCKRHGQQVLAGLNIIRQKHDDLGRPVVSGSLIDLIAKREHLKEPVSRLVEIVCERLSTAVPIAFQTQRPSNEAALNDQIEALISAEVDDWRREFPAIQFGLARTVPDHSHVRQDVLLEAKYLRGGTSPSKATDGIAADLIKYPDECHIVFIVYDPDRSIANDATFSKTFENKGRCTVRVIR